MQIRIKDKLGFSDSTGGLKGKVLFGKGLKQVPFTDPFGKRCYRSEFEKVLYEGENIIPITGYQFVFSKLFNIAPDTETTLRIGDLNDEAPQMKIGVPRDKYDSPAYNAEVSLSDPSKGAIAGVNISAANFVFGFMMGEGGTKEDNITAIAPDYKRRNIFNPIPFRMTNDGYPIPNGRYFGRIDSYSGSAHVDTISSYYIKKFDIPSPRIIHAWVTDNYDEFKIVNDTVFASTSSVPIESYVEINLSISKYDGRGFFTNTHSTPRFNELGLVTGWYNQTKMDYEQIRLFSHIVRPNILLDEEDAIEIIYRIYAR